MTTAQEAPRPPLPPFTAESAARKVRLPKMHGTRVIRSG